MGRSNSYDELTEIVSSRIPMSKKKQFKEDVKKQQKKWKDEARFKRGNKASNGM